MKKLLIILLIGPSVIFGAKPFDEWARPGVFCKLMEQSLPTPTVDSGASNFMGDVGSGIALNLAISMGVGAITFTGRMLFKGGEIAMNQLTEVIKDNNAQATVNIALDPSNEFKPVDDLIENMSYNQLILMANAEEHGKTFWHEELYKRRIKMKLIDPEEY